MTSRHIRSSFIEYFPNLSQISYIYELRRMLGGCATILDIGCGANSPLQFLKGAKLVGVDGYQPALDAARKKGTHDELKLCNVTDIGTTFAKKQFDACVALDVIEHLDKDQGLQLLQEMERIAKKRVVIFTPSGFLPQEHFEDDDMQVHRSGWEPDEMKELGFTAMGLLGHKNLRREEHRIRFRPKTLWGIVSEATNFLYTKHHPEKACAILCSKDISA